MSGPSPGWGHDCKTAADGAEALVVAATFLPDVLLLDLAMPRAEGYEVARRVRELPGLRGVYIVACTGFGDADHVRRATEAGFDMHLLKPVDPETIRELLEQHVAATPGVAAG